MPPTAKLPPKGKNNNTSSSSSRKASMSTSSPARNNTNTTSSSNNTSNSPSSPNTTIAKRTASGRPIGERAWEREKQNLIKLSSEQLMRNALKMHFEILDLRQGAALLADQTSILNDQLTQADAASMYSPSMIPESTIDPQSARRLRSLAANKDDPVNLEGGATAPDGEDEAIIDNHPNNATSINPNSSRMIAAKVKKVLNGNIEDAIKQLSSLQRAIEGGLSVIGPVSPRRMPLLEPDPSLDMSEEAPPEKRLDGTVVHLSQAVHHLLAQAFVLAESVTETQAALQSSPTRAAEYLALRAAVAAGEKEIETENNKSSRLQKQLDAMDDTVRHLRAARGDLEDTCNVSIHQLQAQKERLQEHNSELELKLRTVELERDRAHEEIQRWKEDYDELKDELEESEKEKSKFESEKNMNQLLAEQSKADLQELLESMNNSSDSTVAAVNQLRQQLEAANAKNASYAQQLKQINDAGPLCTEEMLVQQIELQDCEVVEMEERLELESDYFQRFMEMRLRFQRNQMQRSLNDAITKAATLQNQLNDFESEQAEEGAKANNNSKKLQQKLVAAVTLSTMSEREEVRRQEVIMNQDGELIVTLRDLTFSALRDLDASYVTIANQNDEMENMQSRIEQLEYDKHDTKELRGMLDTAQKAFNTADSEAGKLLQYLGQAKDEIARLTEENTRVVSDSNEKVQEMEDKMNEAVEEHEKTRARNEELESCMGDLEKKLSSMIEGLEDKLKNAFAEKENLEKQLERVREEDAELIENYKQQLEASNTNSQKLVEELEQYSRGSLEEVFDIHFIAPQQLVKSEIGDKILMINELENEIAKLGDDLKQRGTASEDQFNQLQKDLEAANGEISNLKNENSTLQQQLVSEKENVQQLQDENSTIKTDLENRASASQDDFRKLQEEKEYLEKELQEKSGELQKLQEHFDKLQKDLESRASASEADYAKLEQELEEANKKVSALEQQLEDKNSEIATLSTDLKKSRDESESLQKQLDEKSEELDLKNAQIEKSKQEIEKLREELSENDQEVRKQRKLLSETGDSAQQRITDLEQSVTDLKHKIETLEAALENSKKEAEASEENAEKLKEEIEKLTDQRDSLQRQLDDVRNSASSSDSEAHKKITDLQQQIEDLKKKLQEEKESAEAREKELIEEQGKLQKAINAEKQRVNELQDNASASESDTKRKVADLECRNVELQTDLDNVTAERDKLRKVSADLSRELEDQKQENADLAAKNEKLTAQLARAIASRDRLKGALKEAVSVQEQLGKIGEIQDANQKLSFDNARLSEQLDQLRAAAADADKQVMLSKTEYAKLEQSIQNAISAEDDLMKTVDGGNSTNNSNRKPGDEELAEAEANTRSTSSSNTPHHEAINRVAATMTSATSTLKRHNKNGEATCNSIQGLMKLIDTLHHQLSLPQPMLMAPTPANTSRGVDSVNDVFPKLMGRMRELIFKASQADGDSNGAGVVGGIDPIEKVVLQEETGRSNLNAEETAFFNEFLEDIIGDIEERAIAEGSKVRRAMEMLEEAQFSMRGRVGSEKLLGALDMLKQTPGARKGAGLAALQGRAKRGGTVILNINEIDPKYRSIAWLVSTRGSMVDHLGDVFKLIFGHPFHLEKTQRAFGTLLGTFLTQIEKMHIGLPPYMLNMEVVKVREATDKELARILVHSSSASSHPSAADSPDCSPVRVLHDGVDRSMMSNSQSPSRSHDNRDASVGTDHQDVREVSSFGSPSGAAAHQTPPARSVVNNWKSPPPPPAWGTFY